MSSAPDLASELELQAGSAGAPQQPHEEEVVEALDEDLNEGPQRLAPEVISQAIEAHDYNAPENQPWRAC